MKLWKALGIGSLLVSGLQVMAQEQKPSEATTSAETPKSIAPTTADVTRKVTARVRTEWLDQSVSTKTTTTTTTKNSGFRMPKMDLTFNNKLGDNVMADIRIAPIQTTAANSGSYTPQSTTANAQSSTKLAPVSNLIEHAWIDYKMGDISLRTGKLDMLQGNIEYMKDSSFDYYLTSYFQTKFISARQLGASVFYSFSGQKLELQLTNGDKTTETDASGTASYATGGNVTTALAYHGDFGAIKPLVTYSQVRYAQPSEDTNGDKTLTVHNGSGRTLVGIGAQVQAAGASLAFEYDLANVDPIKTQAPGAEKVDSVKAEKAGSIILQAKYPIGAFTAVAKVEVATDRLGKDNNADDVDQTGVSIAAEYAIAKDARLYGVYNNVSQTVKSPSNAAYDKKVATGEYIWGAALKI